MNNMNGQFSGIGGQQTSIQLNPFSYPTEVCSECGNETFVPGIIRKIVPGIALGAGTEDVIVPIKVAICAKCGALSPSDKKMIEDEEKKTNKAGGAENKSGLIL